LVYAVLISGVTQKRILIGLQKTIVVATLCIAVQGGVYFLTQAGVLPENRYADLLSFDWESQGIGFHEGYVGMQYPGLNSLPFLIPFLFASLLTRSPGDKSGPVSRTWLRISLFSGLAMVLASGRRALLLVTFMAPLITFFFLRFHPSQTWRLSIRAFFRAVAFLAVSSVIVLLLIDIIYEVNLSSLFDRVSEGFDFRATTFDEGAGARHEQYLALIRGWFENPLLGAGHGASAYGSIRSETMPWAYELSYVALLFQVGLLGFLAYVAGVVWIYWVGIRMIGEGGALAHMMIPGLVGMTCFLVATATNPYLARFDGLWVLFLPLAVINYRLSHFAGSIAHPTPIRATG
jgi:O-antigen ligase